MGCEAGLNPPADLQPPLCTGSLQLDSLRLTQLQPLLAQVEDDGTVLMVVFRIDGEVIGVDHESPWEQGWSPARWKDGSFHTFDVVAVDAAGHVGQSLPVDFLVDPAVAEPGWQAFESRHGGSWEELSHSLLVLGDGSVLVAGTSRPGANAPLAACLARFDREGDSFWYRRIGSGNSDALFSVQTTEENRVLCVGGSGGSPWLWKVDLSGNTVDSRFHAAPGQGAYCSLLPAGSGWIAVGSVWNGSRSDWLLDRLDHDGNLLERQVSGTPEHSEHVMQACTLDDGGMAFTGWIQGPAGTEAYMQRRDARGAVLHEVRFPGCRALAVQGFARGVAISGLTESGTARRAWLALVDGEGGTAAEYSGMDGGDAALAGLLSKGRELVAVGWERNGDMSHRQGLIMRFDTHARPLDRQFLDGGGESALRAISAHPEGGMILAGQTTGNSNGRQDHWVLHVDELGILPADAARIRN